jgi:hypothetical protein
MVILEEIIRWVAETVLFVSYLLVRFVCGLVAIFVLVPMVVLVCTPYLLLTSTADRGEYWSSFWWRTKRLASSTADVAGVIGAGAP